MQKHIATILTFAVVFALLSPSAFARSMTRTGQKNFERAWQAYTSRQQEKAALSFKKASTAYAKALAENPPSRVALFASTLTMAGISFYHSGRFKECIKTMTLAFTKNKKIWETNIFIGLSQARLGDKAKTIEFLTRYLQSMPSQRILSDSVTRPIESINADSVTLIDAADQIDKSMILQFINNINLNNSRSSNPAIERCSGNFWWRRNRSPCTETGYGLNSM